MVCPISGLLRSEMPSDLYIPDIAVIDFAH